MVAFLVIYLQSTSNMHGNLCRYQPSHTDSDLYGVEIALDCKVSQSWRIANVAEMYGFATCKKSCEEEIYLISITDSCMERQRQCQVVGATTRYNARMKDVVLFLRNRGNVCGVQ